MHLLLQAGANQSMAKLLESGQPAEESAVVGAAILPGMIKAISWNGHNSSIPNLFAACSLNEVLVLDLDYFAQPYRVRHRLRPSGAGTLGSGIVWISAETVAVTMGSTVKVLDVTTGQCVWEFSPKSNRTWPMVSLATMGEKQLVSAWGEPDPAEGSGASQGQVHVLDLRLPAHSELKGCGTACGSVSLSSTTPAVYGLCWSPLNPQLLASHTVASEADCESAQSASIYIWDLRWCGGRRSSPGSVFEARSNKPNLGLKGQVLSLDWSPAKSGTLLVALSGDASVQVCRLWETQDAASAAQAEPPEWCGQTQPMLPILSAPEEKETETLVAAAWAHADCPGTAVGLRCSGAPVMLAHRCSKICAWNPRGGGTLVRQWPTNISSIAACSETPPVISVAAIGIPATLEAGACLAAADPSYQMRLRAERYGYGVRRLGYGGYCSTLRATQGLSPIAAEAWIETWHWARLADRLAFRSDDGHPKLWRGVRSELNFQDPGLDGDRSELLHGIWTYASASRRKALRLLDFSQEDGEQDLPGYEVNRNDAGENVRGILRAFLWFEFGRAAAICERLEPSCRPAALLLPQLVLLLHSVSCLLETSCENGSSADLNSRTMRMKAQAHTMQSVLNGLLKETSWSSLPFGSSLQLALKLLGLMIAFTGSSNLSSARDASALHTTLTSPLQEGAGFAHQVHSLLADAASLNSVGRASASFCCAIGLRFLPRALLDTFLDTLRTDCFRSGLPHGLCIVGLGGQRSGSFAPRGLEELACQQGALPPKFSAMPDGGGASRSSSFRCNEGEGAELVAAYVAWSGDVQSAALLFCHAVHLQQLPTSLRYFLATYAAMLSRWQLYRERAALHELLSSKQPQEEAAWTRCTLLHCAWCSSALTGPLHLYSEADIDAIMRRCHNPKCRRATPACAVCLQPIFSVRPMLGDRRAARASSWLGLDSWVTWCQGCHHGGHLAHLEEWFAKNTECPVAGCDCQCASYAQPFEVQT